MRNLDNVNTKTVRANAARAQRTQENKIPQQCPVCGAYAIRVESSIQGLGEERMPQPWWRHNVTFACEERATQTQDGTMPQIAWAKSCVAAWDAALALQQGKK